MILNETDWYDVRKADTEGVFIVVSQHIDAVRTKQAEWKQQSQMLLNANLR